MNMPFFVPIGQVILYFNKNTAVKLNWFSHQTSHVSLSVSRFSDTLELFVLLVKKDIFNSGEYLLRPTYFKISCEVKYLSARRDNLTCSEKKKSCQIMCFYLLFWPCFSSSLFCSSLSF